MMLCRLVVRDVCEVCFTHILGFCGSRTTVV